MSRVKVNTDYFKSQTQLLASEYATEEVVDIITFATAPWGANFKLLPVQRFILKVFYSMPLDDGPPTIPVMDDTNSNLLFTLNEKDFLAWLQKEGRCNLKEYDPSKGYKFRELILCCGRRSSKSTLTSIISAYEVYKLIKKGNPQSYYGKPEGQEIRLTAVATEGDQAEGLFKMMHSRIVNCKYLSDRLVHDAGGYFDLQTDHDINTYGKKGKATIKLVSGGCSAGAQRGPDNILVAMDEMAYFQENGKHSGKAVFTALEPSIAAFRSRDGKSGDGKMIMLSSPGARKGIFHECYNVGWNDPDNSLVFKLYSALINPTIDPNYLVMRKNRDKISFSCEYGAEFSDSITAYIDDIDQFKTCIDQKVKKSRFSGEAHLHYFMGIDLGLKNDGTAITISHRENDRFHIDFSEVYFSGSSDVWKSPHSIYKDCPKDFISYEIIPLDEIYKKINYLCKWFPIKAGVLDQWAAGYSLMEKFEKGGLNQISMKSNSTGSITNMWEFFKGLYAEKLIVLPNLDPLIQELLSLECNRDQKNYVVEAPKRDGCHDDISDSCVRSISLCFEHTQTDYSSRVVKSSNNYMLSQHFHDHVLRKRQMLMNGIISSRDISNARRMR